MKWMLLLSSLVTLAPAQTFIPPDPFGQIKEYLQLTDAQIQGLNQNFLAFARSSSERYARISQVQSDIAELTAKDVLDPLALGIRYAEIEATCRILRNEETKLGERNVSLLTDPQKTKLKVLEDFLKEAQRLGPVIAQAQSARLLAAETTIFPANGFGYTGFPIGAIGPIYPGCSVPQAAPGGVRNLFFSGAPATETQSR